MTGILRWSPEARIECRNYRGWLRQEAGHRITDVWIDALRDRVDERRASPRLGRPRQEFGPNFRTRVFQRSVTIAYALDPRGVTIMRMFGKGRSITATDFTTPE